MKHPTENGLTFFDDKWNLKVTSMIPEMRENKLKLTKNNENQETVGETIKCVYMLKL